MSINEAFITELVNENTAIVVYSDDHEFSPLSVNYTMAERAFLSTKGRSCNEDEREELKKAFAARAVKDREFIDERAIGACEQHRSLVVSGATLDDGIDTWTEAVTADVKDAMTSRGISCAYKLESHLPSVTKLRAYIDAAQSLEV